VKLAHEVSPSWLGAWMGNESQIIEVTGNVIACAVEGISHFVVKIGHGYHSAFFG
jgi:hypothetical protein